MNMITRNMNNIKNNVESIVANIWIMKDTKEDIKGYTKPRFLTRLKFQAKLSFL